MTQAATLEELLEQLAQGDKDCRLHWTAELAKAPFFISNIESLVEMAESPRWSKFLDQLTPVLAMKLENWFSPPSKRQKKKRNAFLDFVQANFNFTEDLRPLDLDVRQLLDIVESPLSYRIPVEDQGLVDEYPQFFQYSDTEQIPQKEDFYSILIHRKYVFSDAEDTNHSIWDDIVRYPLVQIGAACGLQFVVGRNQTEPSTTKESKRPDFVCWLKGLLVLKGEEKGPLLHFDDAVEELVDKMTNLHPTIFGPIPFVFAYAAANSHFQLYAIDRSKNITELSTRFNLMNAGDRLEVAFRILKLIKVFKSYQQIIPTNALSLYSTRDRNGVMITVYEDYIEKVVPRKPWMQLDHLESLYDSIAKDRIPNLICCSKFKIKSGKFKLILKPLGFICRIHDEKLLIKALKDVALALSGLHERKFVHRDVRWPNILRLVDGSFMLIDLENSGAEGEAMPVDLLNSRIMDPELGEHNSVYNSASDMYQFGKLISAEINLVEDLRLRGLYEALIGPSQSRPTAKEAFATLKKILKLKGGKE